ncbi:DNA sulfur modification protein DndD [Geomonas azotofigens]|uniref:DNA sulfur modification protein DndD n=1 Tax=Geomonas azotofigens TaxID=2843196 RepID=UPI001C128381|nr:DNA sulfur modification protein DndD [Geomonas azotofigens]MBU5612633.1 DNA sulfur modification protein DndD [Geomonas azotofigens]
MILDKVVLENFGVYGGRQEADLSPKPGKPIILFGGMNGGGKTTLLDAIQLAFYGSKAHTSNRGRLPYKEYLRQSIHRKGHVDGASITVGFRRVIEGQTRQFELIRSWCHGVKGIEESVRVYEDGSIDEIISEHWEEAIEAYLPSSISHLFFFDGEQIKELAEGGHAAEILGTAIRSLLGLDLVDRLETDLKVFERKKKGEGLDPETSQKLAQARGELEEIDHQQAITAMQEGALVNETGRLAKDLRAKEERFREEGGELFLRRQELEEELTSLKAEKAEAEAQYRELIAGPLPLSLVDHLLGEVERAVLHETDIKRARLLLTVLEARDKSVLSALKKSKLPANSLSAMGTILEEDRAGRAGLAQECLVLNADDALALRIGNLREKVLPSARQQAHTFSARISALAEKIARVENELERVPTADRIADIQQELNLVQRAHQEKLLELEALKVRQEALRRQKLLAEARVDKIAAHNIDANFTEDARLRMIKHSQKVRTTLTEFRKLVVQRHTEGMENLMLDSFQKLLRKKDLVTGLTIDPESFETILTTKEGTALPFDRLSAGEKQLLATSMLWGLARASGRPVPTIIDTPLGRLDSSHRKHLVQRYFPNASHQVLLLSTDEEIIGPYYQAIKPFISRCYLLDHDEKLTQTNIKEGYFEK